MSVLVCCHNCHFRFSTTSLNSYHSKDLKKCNGKKAMQQPTKPSWGAPNILHIPHIHWTNTDSTILLLLRSSDPPFAFYLTRRMGQLFPLLIFSIAVNFSSFIIGSNLWLRTTAMTPMHAADRFVWSYFSPHSDGPISPSLCFFSPWYCN